MEYRELLGTCLCVFNANNSFIIENVLANSNDLSWYNLMDLESGKLQKQFKKLNNLQVLCRSGKLT